MIRELVQIQKLEKRQAKQIDGVLAEMDRFIQNDSFTITKKLQHVQAMKYNFEKKLEHCLTVNYRNKLIYAVEYCEVSLKQLEAME